MVHPLPQKQDYFRVTTLGRRWKDVLSGRGALYLPPTGNRYNVVLQRAAYVSDELNVAVTEFAYYVARDWQTRLGNHHLLPVPSPLRSNYVLWQFTLQQPRYVIDVEAGPPLVLLPPFSLLNPCHHYAATQWLANHAIATPAPGHAPPHPGLKVPAVRSRHGTAAQQSNFVLYRQRNSPKGQLVARWRLQIEFLDTNGNPVAAGSRRVDWACPRFQLLANPGATAPRPPAPQALNTWHPLAINFL
jgi:hypothetical protein